MVVFFKKRKESVTIRDTGRHREKGRKRVCERENGEGRVGGRLCTNMYL